MMDLFSPVQIGALRLRNRIVMAPMTRCRAGPGDVPGDLTLEYYSQRAGAGLLITEGTHPSKHGKGYCRTPGACTPEQFAGWKRVVEAVHARGASIVLQLMHCGRIGSKHNKDRDAMTVAPSAIRAAGTIYTDSAGMVEFDEPRALTALEIRETIDEYARAAESACAAGFEGVELHATSGYLPMQFLSTGTNHRMDSYGGALNNRLRFVVETLEAMTHAIGPGRVGFRICPGNPFNDMHDDDPAKTYSALLRALRPLDLAYVHAIRSHVPEIDVYDLAREHFHGSVIANDGFGLESGQTAIREGAAHAVSYGRAFIANPDLVERFANKSPLARFDSATLYTPGAEGYTTYPRYRPEPGSVRNGIC
jgi:N-ethylmaleimide reductase